MPHTFIILDGHPNAFIPTIRIENTSVPPTHQLPPLPLWACMVQSSLEFCRVAWDIQQTKKNMINVMVAGGSPFILNDTTEQNIQILQQKFPPVQPRQAYPHDRMQPTIGLALKKYLEKKDMDTLQRCRIVLLIVAKQNSEKAFEYRNDTKDESCRDLRSMVYDALEKANSKHPTKTLSHVQVDILRLLPYSESAEYRIPPKIISKRISPQITMSVYNIPNGPDDLKFAMRNLSQLYYNINVLHISNIPMKSAENTQSTQTVTLYYQANGYHLINQQEPFKTSHIHDPKYLKNRELKLIYSKRSKRALPESEWCTCMHSISPIKLHDLPTEVYLGMTFKGSISYLVTPETKSSTWTHILMAQDGGIFLHCLNSQLQKQFVQAEQTSVDIMQVSMLSVEPKTREMMDTIIRPNLFENVHEYISATSTNPLCKMVPVNPFRFSHHLPIMTLNEKGLCTSRWIEKATRWRTCFRDCEGTDRFTITQDSDRPIADIATDVLNGIPVSSGFGIAFGLIHDLLEQIQDILLKDRIPKKDVSKTEQLIDMTVLQLMNGITGTSQKMFIKGLRKDDAKLLSKKLLVGLYLAGKRFMRDSDTHEQLCTFMLQTIDAKSENKLKAEDEGDNGMPVAAVKTEQDYNIDAAWNQVSRYESMSLRERDDAAQGYLPEFKPEGGFKEEPMAFAGQLPHNMRPPAAAGAPVPVPRANPNFKSRRGATTTTASMSPANINNSRQPQQPYNPRYPHQQQQQQTKQKYPDPSLAVPYLTFVAPTLEEKAQEEAAEENSLGEPGNLLWLYWMNDKVKKRGNGEEGDLSSGTELVYKNQQWKRVKKEFLGRTAQPGEQGEMLL